MHELSQVVEYLRDWANTWGGTEARRDSRPQRPAQRPVRSASLSSPPLAPAPAAIPLLPSVSVGTQLPPCAKCCSLCDRILTIPRCKYYYFPLSRTQQLGLSVRLSILPKLMQLLGCRAGIQTQAFGLPSLPSEPITLAIQVWSPEPGWGSRKYQYLPGGLLECRISGPSRPTPNENLHFLQDPQVVHVLMTSREQLALDCCASPPLLLPVCMHALGTGGDQAGLDGGTGTGQTVS